MYIFSISLAISLARNAGTKCEKNMVDREKIDDDNDEIYMLGGTIERLNNLKILDILIFPTCIIYACIRTSTFSEEFLFLREYLN